MIIRTLQKTLQRLSGEYPVVTLTGPRQSGKTTLCRAAFPRADYASLEDPDLRSFALEDPRGFLDQFSATVVLDEVQRAPELFSYIQTMVDRDDSAGQFIPQRLAELPATSVHQPVPRRALGNPPSPSVFDG